MKNSLIIKQNLLIVVECVDNSNIFIGGRYVDGGWAAAAAAANLRSCCSSATNFARRSSLAASSCLFVPNKSNHFSSRLRVRRDFDFDDGVDDGSVSLKIDDDIVVVLPPVSDGLYFDSVVDELGATERLWICTCDRYCSLR